MLHQKGLLEKGKLKKRLFNKCIVIPAQAGISILDM
jgi:hypothetical protein